MRHLLNGQRAALLIAVGLALGALVTAGGPSMSRALAQSTPPTGSSHEHSASGSGDMGSAGMSSHPMMGIMADHGMMGMMAGPQMSGMNGQQVDDAGATSDRQQIIHEHGSSVMPFDLSLTTHHFQSLPDGGLQTVTANEPTDQAQIALIQQHLSELATQFQQGDFSDPATLHGADMPGLAVLSTAGSRLQIVYSPTSDGAQIRYTTQDPEVLAALEQWFAAQLADHGRDAMDR